MAVIQYQVEKMIVCYNIQLYSTIKTGLFDFYIWVNIKKTMGACPIVFLADEFIQMAIHH
jgi:hypothetical protein